KPAVRTKPRPAHIRANVRVANLAMTAGAIAPSRRDDNMVTWLETGSLGYNSADPVYNTRDFMTQGDRRRDVSVFSEVTVHELNVGAAHTACLDLNENFIGLNVRHWHVFKHERFTVLVHARGFHRCLLSSEIVQP